MRTRFELAGLIVLAMLGLLSSSCSSPRGSVSCLPGQVVECPCPGAGPGAQTCSASWSYGACNCGGPVPMADASTMDVAVTPRDAGVTPPVDGYTPPTDAAVTPPVDGFTPPTDAGGTPTIDVFTPPTDTGVTPTVDVFTPPTDTGVTPIVDAGALTDGASADVGPVDVPPGSCGFVSGEVSAHVTAMTTMGWGALNRSRGMLMHGCAGARRPQDCLATVPLADATDIGANRSAIPVAHLRVLYTGSTRSGYWTRSSADGRFVGRGVHLRDLARGADVAAAGAMYNPAFYPDNSGFMYQPGGRNCPMSALTTATPTSVAISGAGSPCSGSSAGLYQHLAASLDGADYWASSAGTAAWDDGGHTPTLTETPRNERWTATAQTSITLMANTGAGFSNVGSRSVVTPLQGDAVISPSSRLLMTRFIDDVGAYQGYILNRLEATHTGSAITASAREIGRYCVQGAKPAFSFDERFITYHHYIGGGAHVEEDARELGFSGAADPAFADYLSRGAANIYIMDLRTGRPVRVTNMGPGQYALYPHFRSDGWLYFLVRTLGTTAEHVIASDAALFLP